MSKVMRVKFVKYGDMMYISHLDVQRLLQRAFRRADIELSFSQGFNPHPKMSYGNALSLGVESFGEYVDIEIEQDITSEELVERINLQLPETFKFIKCIELVGGEKSLAANIEFSEYDLFIEIENTVTEEEIKNKLEEFLSEDEINVTKKNKKGKLVEVNIRPLISKLNLDSIENGIIKINTVLATGSKNNLNLNVFIPKLLEVLNINIDPLDVSVQRKDLFFLENGELTTPI